MGFLFAKSPAGSAGPGWFLCHSLITAIPWFKAQTELNHLLTYLREKRDAEKWSYVEIRPTDSEVTGATSFGKSKSFYLPQTGLTSHLR